MRRAIITVGLAALAVSACGINDNSGPRMVQMCADRAGNYLPDYMCDGPAGIYPMAVPYYMPWSTYHNTVEVHHYHYSSGQRLTGGSTRAPRTARVQSASHPGKVTVFSSGKKTVTSNKKAQSFGTVTGQTKKTNAYTPQHAASRVPSYGTPPKPVARSGKCC